MSPVRFEDRSRVRVLVWDKSGLTLLICVYESVVEMSTALFDDVDVRRT